MTEEEREAARVALNANGQDFRRREPPAGIGVPDTPPFCQFCQCLGRGLLIFAEERPRRPPIT
jgi:hypothetical protein